MKILNILAIFIGVLFVFSACEKDDPVKLDRQMNTWQARNITSTSAELAGIVVAEGSDNTISEYGVCWSKNEKPTVKDSKSSITKREKAVYWVKAENLEHLTKYYARAYAVVKNGSTLYGKEISFSTLANIPYVEIQEAANVTGKTVKIISNLTSDGKADVTEKGICWSVNENPTPKDNVMKSIDNKIGEFITLVEGLHGNTTYYVRSYAKNKIGIGYSKQITFTTQVATPTLTTDSTKNVAKTSLDVYGTVVVSGGADVTERGFCWATTENPEATDANKKVFADAGVGSYNVTIESLSPGTEYFIRAYAINSKGVAYGNNVKVKTVTDIQKLYVPGGYQKASGYGADDWKPENAPFIMNTKDDKELQGYVYFAAASEFKLTTDPDWNHTNYGKGEEGKLSATGGNLSVDAPGLYLIKADLVNLTYSTTKVSWFIINH